MRLILQLCLLLLVPYIRCQCPHMAGTRVAPPALSPHSSIQTTFLYKNLPGETPSTFALLVAETLQKVKKSLREKANLSIDNENIHCEVGSAQPPCTDYEGVNAFNLFILEDSKIGARVYSLEEELNGVDERRVEAAILDALSRHSKRDLTVFSSPPAEKTVGFVHELTTEELEEMGRRRGASEREGGGSRGMHESKHAGTGTILSPLLNHPLDKKIIQMRSTATLSTSPKNLLEVSSNEEMDEILAEKAHLFILFWSITDTVSVHALALFANASVTLPAYEDTVLAHVPCHEHVNFCTELTSRDLHMIVGYSNGAKVATLSEMVNDELYKDWIEIVRAGPVRELAGAEQIKEAKKGFVDGKRRLAVTIGTFPSREDVAFRHFQMAADKLFGQYYLFYAIKEGSLPSIQTYRHAERRLRRQGHADEFDPLSIARFIVDSSVPSILSITPGFCSSYALRGGRKLIVLLAAAAFDADALAAFSAHHSAAFVVAHVDTSTHPSSASIQSALLVSSMPHLVLFDKTKVWHMEVDESNTEEEITEWSKEIVRTEPDLVLSPFGVHPLQLLQLAAVDRVFGTQMIDPPEDPSLFSPLPAFDSLSALRESHGSTGGCPFMNGQMNAAEAAGVDAQHDEL